MIDFIQETLDKLRTQKAVMLEEVKRIDAAILALGGVQAKSQPNTGVNAPNKAVANYGKYTKKELILGALKHYPNGLPLANISPRINELYGIVVKKQNISPALTKLRKSKDIEQYNDKWFLTENLPKSATQSSFEALEPSLVRQREGQVFYGGGSPE